MIRIVLLTLLASLVATTTPVRAQLGPEDTIRQILEQIDEELDEIDKMLLETSARDAIASGERSTEQLQKLMKETQDSQGRVVRGIEQLIEELEKMQSSSSSQGGGEPQPGEQQRSQDPLEDQQQGERRDGEIPDQQRQTQPRPDRQPSQEDDTQPNPTEGQNVESSPRPEDAQERAIREADRARWGNLPDYDIHQHIRGGLPEVPEKYRRFLEAYQKTNQRSGGRER